MITLLILVILFIGAYSGYKNGIIEQLLKTIGYVISLILAFDYYDVLSEYLELIVPYPSPFAPQANPYSYYEESLMFSLDQSYYHLISFFTIFVLGWFITRIIVQLLSYTLTKIKVPEPLNGVGGSVLGFVVNYLGVFYILFILTTIPLGFVQDRLSESFVADKMVTSSPIVSKDTYQKFIVEVNEEVKNSRPLMDIESSPEEEDAEDNGEE